MPLRQAAWVLCFVLCVHQCCCARAERRPSSKSRQLLQCGVPNPDPLVNECLNGDHNCDDNAACTDTDSSFLCACRDGFSGSGVQCTDVNECSQDLCDASAACTNTHGSFTCSCNDGYTGDGTTSCSDEDECTNDPCHSMASCTNTVGSYTCVCGDGYSGNGRECTDDDECASDGGNDCHEMASCSNTAGSFTCQCNAGYGGDGLLCVDVNECDNSPCLDAATCANSDGSFSCTCNGEFVGDGVVQCVASSALVDECAGQAHDCDVDADCTDTASSFECTCRQGYSGSGVTCTDVDECDLGADNCDANADCTNSAGGFTCACKDGFTGSGVECTAVEAEEPSVSLDDDDEEDGDDEYQMAVTTVLVGVTVEQAEAREEEIKEGIAQTLSGVVAAQVDIVAFNAVASRRLLSDSVSVDFTVSGFASQADAEAAMDTLDESTAELVAELKTRGLQSLTDVSVSSASATKVVVVETGSRVDTPSPTAPPDGETSVAATAAGSAWLVAVVPLLVVLRQLPAL